MKRAGGKRSLLLVPLVAVAAFVIRAVRLGEYDFWYDECFSGLTTFDRIPDMLRAVHSEVTPPLYYVLLRAWATAFGHGEASLRLLSVCAGGLTAGLVVIVGCRVSRAVGAAAGLFVALSPLHVYYSREARMYAVLVLLLSGAIAFLLQALHTEGRERRMAWIGYSICGTLAIWTHYFAVFALVAAPFAAVGRGRRAIASACTATLVAGALAVPLAPMALAQSRLPATEWIAEAYHAIPPWQAIFRTLEIFAPGALYPAYAQFHFAPPPWRPLAFLLLGATLLPGTWAALRGQDGERYVARVGLAFLIVPLASMWAISLIRPVYLLGRYDLIAFPGYAILVGTGIVHLPKLLAILVGSVGGILAIVSLAPLYDAPPGHASLRRTVAERLVPALGTGDSVLFTGFSQTETRYALRLAGANPLFRTVPRSSANHAGWVDLRLLRDPAAVRTEATSAAREAAVAAGRSRVWLIVDPRAPGSRECADALHAMGYRSTAQMPLLPEYPLRWGAPLAAVAFSRP